jgi:3-deoxy-manno-octulosonate cytidylyltransferase (CMP-KDO synthetase)
MNCAIVIPARMASTRFPGKPLADLCGKPMIQWVYEAAKSAEISDRVIIAAPDEQIISAATAFGAEAISTRLDHPSGTDRLAEVAETLDVDFLVSVQGDEPLIDPATIRICAQPLFGSPEVQMASAYCHRADEDIDNPAVVKVVTDLHGNALYFSRHAIPYARNPRLSPVRKHVGIYAYRRDVLLNFAKWEPTQLERTESLEQLRFLEHGISIQMSLVEENRMAVDTPEQAEEVRKLLTAKRS